jgi:hypothetical protein
MAVAKKTNTVKFGRYAIVLEKDQLMYFTDGELAKVRDVNPAFNTQDLYDLAVRITEKNGYGPVENTTKDKVVKKY